MARTLDESKTVDYLSTIVSNSLEKGYIGSDSAEDGISSQRIAELI